MPRLARASLALLVLTFTPTLPAQTGNASLQGTIRDSSSAVVPSSRVAALRIETGRRYQTVTNQVGFYLFPPMEPGEYRITIEAQGMKTLERTVQLATGQQAVV